MKATAPRRRPSALAGTLIATAVLLAACSTGDPASDDVSPCDTGIELSLVLETPDSDRSYDVMVDALERAQEGAPDEIRDDLAVLVALWRDVRPQLEAVGWDGTQLDESAIDEATRSDLEEAGKGLDAFYEESCGIPADGGFTAEMHESTAAAKALAARFGMDESEARCVLDALGVDGLNADEPKAADLQLRAFEQCEISLSSVAWSVDSVIAQYGVSESEAKCMLDEVGYSAVDRSGGFAVFAECEVDVTSLKPLVESMMDEMGVSESEAKCMLEEFREIGTLGPGDTEAIQETCGVGR